MNKQYVPSLDYTRYDIEVACVTLNLFSALIRT